MTNIYLPPVITIPSSLLITNITQSSPMIVSVSIGNSISEANTYIVGMLIKLFVPQSYRMYQANGLTGTIISINGLNFTLNLNSLSFDAFVIPSSTGVTPASISPYGSRNLEYNNTNINQVPFQSLNNIGN